MIDGVTFRVPLYVPLVALAALLPTGADDFEPVHAIAGTDGTGELGAAVDADGDLVVVGDLEDRCRTRARPCAGSVSIYRASPDGVVLEARFEGEAERLGGSVAIHGNRVVANVGNTVEVYERDGSGTWRRTDVVDTSRCPLWDEYLHRVVLDDDAFVVMASDRVCVWDRADGAWRANPVLTSRTWTDGHPVIDHGLLAVPLLSKDRVELYRRERDGWRMVAEIPNVDVTRVALSSTTLVVRRCHAQDTIDLYDITGYPWWIARVHAQSDDNGWTYAQALAIDETTLAASSRDGIHIYERVGDTWNPAGIVPRTTHDGWWGYSLALTPRWLWVGDLDLDHRRGGGLVHGLRRRAR